MNKDQFNTLKQGDEVTSGKMTGKVYSVDFETERVSVTVVTPLYRRGRRTRINYGNLKLVGPATDPLQAACDKVFKGGDERGQLPSDPNAPKNFTPVTERNVAVGNRVKSMGLNHVFRVGEVFKDGVRFQHEETGNIATYSWAAITGHEFIHYEKDTVAASPATARRVNYDARTGDVITLKAATGDKVKTITGTVKDSYPSGVLLENEEGLSRTYNYDTLIGREAVYMDAAPAPAADPKAEVTDADRAAVMDIRYTEIRDRLEELDYRRVSSHTSADNPHNEISSFHTYIRGGDGQKLIVRVHSSRAFKILEVDVYKEVSNSIQWTDYLAAID